MNWYIAPVVAVDIPGGSNTSPDVTTVYRVGSNGKPYPDPLFVHIGRSAPTECLVGVEATPPADWVPLDEQGFTDNFVRLFGREPLRAEREQG